MIDLYIIGAIIVLVVIVLVLIRFGSVLIRGFLIFLVVLSVPALLINLYRIVVIGFGWGYSNTHSIILGILGIVGLFLLFAIGLYFFFLMSSLFLEGLADISEEGGMLGSFLLPALVNFFLAVNYIDTNVFDIPFWNFH